jgi:1-acyl-sn-glycerol-3-phosphate acyltransferase
MDHPARAIGRDFFDGGGGRAMIQMLFGLIERLPKRARRSVVRWFMDRIWNRYVNQTVVDKAYIPTGPCLFICNHLSNADGFTLFRALRPKQFYFLAGVKLQETVMTRVATEAVDFISIRPNSPDIEALKRTVEALKAGQSVLIFPEGTRSRGGGLMRGKRGAAMVAKRAGVPIIPIGLTGTERFLPINDTDMGGEQVHHADVVVRIGKPFSLADLDLVRADGQEEDERQLVVDAMMRKVAELLPPAYQGIYNQSI